MFNSSKMNDPATGQSDSQNSQDQNSQDNADDSQTPIDGIIARVDAYIKNPNLVTPQTLMELKTELVDLKDYLDAEESQEGEPGQNSGMNDAMSQLKGEKPGLMIAIGKGR